MIAERRALFRRRIAVLLITAVPVIAASFAAPRQDPDDPTAPWPRQGRYVGQEKCRECHEVEAELIDAGVHRSVVHSPATMACETCHGPGARHAEDSDGPLEKITYPPKLSPKDQAALCTRCHAPEAIGHGGGGMQGFLEAGLGCTECHFVHEEHTGERMAGVRLRSRAATLAAAEPVESAKCASCHPLQHGALSGTGHRGLAQDEPLGGCTVCHGNGSLHVQTQGVGRLISRPDVALDGPGTCVSCHTDVDPLRAHWPDADGPWLDRGLDCFACHRIHGERPAGGEPLNQECASCHARAFEEHVPRDSVHGGMVRPELPLRAGCGACHDGALEHARSGGKPDLVESLRAADRATTERACLSCHRDEPALHGLHGGAHARSDVSCTACHSPSPKAHAVTEDAEQHCASCHGAVAARFRLPHRHPVHGVVTGPPDGHMACSDCHEPHSARPRLRDDRLREDRCVECHRAYRGPFVFEHQASRLDGCVVCHDPHGSSNRRMLHEASTQQNCIACHGDFPAFHDQSLGSVFRNCLECHTEIHGSNHSRFFFR